MSRNGFDGERTMAEAEQDTGGARCACGSRGEFLGFFEEDA